MEWRCTQRSLDLEPSREAKTGKTKEYTEKRDNEDPKSTETHMKWLVDMTGRPLSMIKKRRNYGRRTLCDLYKLNHSCVLRYQQKLHTRGFVVYWCLPGICDRISYCIPCYVRQALPTLSPHLKSHPNLYPDGQVWVGLEVEVYLCLPNTWTPMFNSLVSWQPHHEIYIWL